VFRRIFGLLLEFAGWAKIVKFDWDSQSSAAARGVLAATGINSHSKLVPGVAPASLPAAITDSGPDPLSSQQEPVRVSASPVVVDLTSLPPTRCPCGVARRAFADRSEFPGTVHLTEITRDAQEHYHTAHSEVYVILDCAEDAAIELDGVRTAVKPRTAVLIPPGVRHRACGEMTVLILCTPNFDPADEHF